MKSSLDNQSGALVLERSRFADFVTLTKPELTFLSVLTAVGGYYLGSSGAIVLSDLAHLILGTLLVGGGAGALNQFMERKYDALMKRTENRPIPSGRMAPRIVLNFGLLFSTAGLIDLLLYTNSLVAALACITLVTYLLVYTPLKRITPHSTLIGGIPGALPPVMGWAAAKGAFGVEAALLFLVLFFWQMPHFLSLAWMYKKDYARAGYRLLAVLDPDGIRTGNHILAYTIALLVITLLPALYGGVGVVYGVGAAIAGGTFLLLGIQLRGRRSSLLARRVFAASLLYLPALLFAVIIDRL